MNFLNSFLLVKVFLVVLLSLTPAYGQDADLDGISDEVDNCSSVPNGDDLGTCLKLVGGVLKSTGVTCEYHEDCAEDEMCDKFQWDLNENRVGDACECYTDCDCDNNVNILDLISMKREYLRSDCASEYCYADANEDGTVNLFDLVIMRTEYLGADCGACGSPIGVLFVFHGGMIHYKPQYMFDAVAHQFSYDPNHSVYKFVIWNSAIWPDL